MKALRQALRQRDRDRLRASISGPIPDGDRREDAITEPTQTGNLPNAVGNEPTTGAWTRPGLDHTIFENKRETEPTSTISYRPTPNDGRPLPDFGNQKIYQPIPTAKNVVRILVLLPGTRGSRLSCTLQCGNLDDSKLIAYEALSYAWGDSQLSRLIWVNGKVMGISQNLESALEHLRHPSEPRNLWVDAICIDQGNVLERNEQVALMRDIYRSAQRVLVWLGESTEDSDLAFDLIETLSGDDFPGDMDGLDDLDDLDMSALHTSLSIEMSRVAAEKKKRHMRLVSLLSLGGEIPERTMQALRGTFTQRAWWSRIWVIQEVVSAREALLICGERSFAWNVLETLLDLERGTILVKHTTPRVLAQLASTMHSAILFTAVRNQYKGSQISNWIPQNGVYKSGMCSLIALFETNLCTDPRDRIYALQNITVSKTEQIEPDYRKASMEVFAQSTKAMMESSRELDVLAYAYRSNDMPQGRPSWAPDWSISRQFSTLISGPRKDRLYKLSLGTTHVVPSIAYPYWLLPLKGFFKDTITHVHQVVDTKNSQWRDWFKVWLPDGMRSTKSIIEPSEFPPNEYPESLGRCDEYWRCLMLDVHRPTGWPARIKGSKARHHYRDLFLSWTQHPRYSGYKSRRSSLPLTDTDLETYSERTFEECMGEHLHGWAFIQTERGSLGWVPQTARVGDRVCRADGSSLPLILRKAGPEMQLKAQEWTRDDVFELVGTAYIHGIMDSLYGSLNTALFLV